MARGRHGEKRDPDATPRVDIDKLARALARVARLEKAIRDHRAVMHSHDGSLIRIADHALWSVLADGCACKRKLGG
jgi:hypothetical protein